MIELRKLRITISVIALVLSPILGVQTSIASANSAQTIPIQRIYGQDRYQTALAIADKLAPTFGIHYEYGQQFQAVVLASGNNWPDAVCGTALAKLNKAPILLLDKTVDSTGSKETFTYMSNHVGPGAKVFILGGKGVISDEFTQHLVSMGYSIDNIQQIGGANRDETSFLVSKLVPPNNYYLVSDSNFYDALTIAPDVAYSPSTSILLVPDSSLVSGEEKGYLDRSDSVTAVGSLINNIKNVYPRIYSSNGYSAAVNSSEYATNAVWAERRFKTAIIATGEDYPDALTGSVLAGSIDPSGVSPIILVQHDYIDPKAIPYLSYARLEPDFENITDAIILGGPAAVTDNVANQLINTITNNTSELSSDDSVTSFTFSNNTSIQPEIMEGVNCINATVSYNDNLTALIPNIVINTSATISPLSGIPRDFTNPVTYTITAQDGSRKSYTVNLTRMLKTEAPTDGITGFSFPSLNAIGTIDGANHIITVTVHKGSNITNLLPTVTVADGETVNAYSLSSAGYEIPLGMQVPLDFSRAVEWQYIVTKADGSQEYYQVNVNGQ